MSISFSGSALPISIDTDHALLQPSTSPPPTQHPIPWRNGYSSGQASGQITLITTTVLGGNWTYRRDHHRLAFLIGISEACVAFCRVCLSLFCNFYIFVFRRSTGYSIRIIIDLSGSKILGAAGKGGGIRREGSIPLACWLAGPKARLVLIGCHNTWRRL